MAPTPHRRADPALRPHLQPAAMAMVAGGATLGAAARDAIAQAWPAPHDGLPGATLTINLSGAFLLGLLLEALLRRGGDAGARRARLVVGTGFLGAYTTYSTFAVEGALLVRHGRVWVALGYATATVLAGLLATAAGVTLGARRR